jgi:hypothetical protein
MTGWQNAARIRFWTVCCHLSATVLACAVGAASEGRRTGEATMTIGILNDLLLFSCLVVFVTGIVIAAASLLI